MAAAGKAEGIHFALDRIERTPNTLAAHRLIWMAGQQGIQDAFVETLFMAYFTEGGDSGHRQTLIDVVARAALDRYRSEAVLTSGDGTRGDGRRSSNSQHSIDFQGIRVELQLIHNSDA